MRRETENILLLIVGIALVMVSITGAYTRYVKPAMLPWLAISAAVVIALALVAIARVFAIGAPTTTTPATLTGAESSGFSSSR